MGWERLATLYARIAGAVEIIQRIDNLMQLPARPLGAPLAMAMLGALDKPLLAPAMPSMGVREICSVPRWGVGPPVRWFPGAGQRCIEADGFRADRDAL